MGVLAGFSFAFCHFSSLALFAFSFFSFFNTNLIFTLILLLDL